MTMRYFAAALSAGLIGAWVPSASAVQIEFQLNATFPDGSTADGSSVFDSDTATFSNTLIQYDSSGVASPLFASNTFSVIDEPFSDEDFLSLFPAGTDISSSLAGTPNLLLDASPGTFSDPNVAVTVSIGFCVEPTCINVSGRTFAEQTSLSGRVPKPIPLPAGLPLLRAGLASLGLIARGRKIGAA